MTLSAAQLATVQLLGFGWIADDRPGARQAAGRLLLSAVCVVLLLLSARTGAPTQWSTYQKLTMTQNNTGLVTIFANGIAHQFMHPAALAEPAYYGEPYRQAAAAGIPLNNVLIIGAGSGTDVAVALAHGAKAIDAVEIDGRIVDWGRALHPDSPYSNQGVQVHVTDGRKYLQATRRNMTSLCLRSRTR